MVRTWLYVVTGLFLVRMGVNLAHGWAHDALSVPLAHWQHGFVWMVILLGPLGAMIWLWVRPGVAAAWTLAGLIAAGWIFGLYFHFGPVNPDHVSTMPQGSDGALFVRTAIGLAVIEPVLAAAATWMGAVMRRGEVVHG